MRTYALGIDVGSTTVKTVIVSDENEIIYTKYERHFSKVRETVINQLSLIANEYVDYDFKINITGSAGLGMAGAANLPFIQEVFAAFVAVKESYSDADVVIELGGEDAKIIFLTGGTEQRMNGSCAGGTGAFIDQMATLLGITADELDELALKAKKIYPIASRCGVFAKSDIQPLLNQGANREDISASIFNSVVEQTVSGLAQGRKIEGKVLFLGGPLSFLKGLRKAFVQSLELDSDNAIFPETAPCFMAYGSALAAKNEEKSYNLPEVIEILKTLKLADNIITDEPLFANKNEYHDFVERHKKCDLPYADINTYSGNAYLGIDAGSTTTKLVLISENNELLFQFYTSNKGRPLDVVAKQLGEIYKLCGDKIKIVSSAVTGYGEDLIKAGLGMDFGIVETVAHFKAASYFKPNVDFIIDIGGQDIKCFKIKNNAIDSIMLNEACSSGCGSFIQTFALALGYDIAEFSQLGLFAKHPVDLGSRCTVFMNSSVKQAQKDGASVEDISAGLSSSIIKNAIYKVIRAKSASDLGENIVVQGGTFLNDAVLRSFEKELGKNVSRPAISGLMGAFGAALYAKENTVSNASSSIISQKALADFSYSSQQLDCKGCTAKCNLTVIKFADGSKHISGNRCEKGAGLKPTSVGLDLYAYKYRKVLSYAKNPAQNLDNKPIKARVGIPMVLGFYELLPFWATFLNELGFEVVLSEESTRQTYFKGQSTIPSDTVCYPAKLAHGHIESLHEKGVDFIFYPTQSYNVNEGQSDNHFNCPVVAFYGELLKANIPSLNDYSLNMPYVDINLKKHSILKLTEAFSKYSVTKKEVSSAYDKAMKAWENFLLDIQAEGARIVNEARKQSMPIIVLAGRPYHLDPEINHGINKLLTSLGVAVITEDSIYNQVSTPDLDILNQWTYHSRLFRAAKYVTTQQDMQLIQLVSFGCGIDSITTDEVRKILENEGKLYTQLKIDEINNLGTAKIRIRSLLASIEDIFR